MGSQLQPLQHLGSCHLPSDTHQHVDSKAQEHPPILGQTPLEGPSSCPQSQLQGLSAVGRSEPTHWLALDAVVPMRRLIGWFPRLPRKPYHKWTLEHRKAVYSGTDGDDITVKVQELICVGHLSIMRSAL